MEKQKHQRGQTTTEYMMILVVSVILVTSLFGRVREALIGDSECPNTSFLCQIEQNLLGPGYLSGNFEFFRLRR